MKEAVVSIIVPVYKVEKYLSCCLDSILAQSFRDFELLLIDDGSPDLSGKICDDYAEKDARIRVFHKQNEGVSSARNLGLDNAQGEWICFIDSDDWVEVDFLKELVQYNSFDLVVGGLDSFGCVAISTKRDENVIIDLTHSYEAAEILNANSENTISVFYYSCGKLFRRSIISRNALRFDTRMKMCEDTCFLMQYLVHVDKIILSDSSLYRYRIISMGGKHLLNSQQYNVHYNLFEMYLFELEYFYKVSFNDLKREIYSALLIQFILYIKTIKKSCLFLEEIKGLNKNERKIEWQEIKLSVNQKKMYRFVFLYPYWGYYLLKSIKILKQSVCNSSYLLSFRRRLYGKTK